MPVRQWQEVQEVLRGLRAFIIRSSRMRAHLERGGLESADRGWQDTGAALGYTCRTHG